MGSLCVNVALTSEACYKGLPRTQNGDVVTFRGQLKRLLFHKVRCLILMTNFNSNYCEQKSVRINIENNASCTGWPRLQWFVTEHLGKPPKDWLPPPRQSDEAPAYVEVSTLSFHVKIESRSDRCTGVLEN